jgi:HYR domain
MKPNSQSKKIHSQLMSSLFGARKETHLMGTKILRNMLFSFGVIFALAAALPVQVASNPGASYVPDCNDPDAHDLGCVEPTQALIQQARAAGYPYYIGHAEPTALFFSSTGTSGYNMQWKLQLPASDPAPAQDGSTVANFQLYSVFWIGLALCDPNSNPFGACVATSDANNPSTAGAAVLELQFFPPPDCGGTNDQWCVLLHINTFQNATMTQINNCLEPTTAKFVTTDGTPGGPKLLMSSGDSILVTIHDTANGLQTDVNDVTSGATGSMVASGANGFVHNANQTDCTTTPFDFHAMYATASPGQGVPWASLGLNVAFDFEIGHYELCGDSSCTTLPDGADEGTCSKSTNTLCKVNSDCPTGETCNVQTVASCGTVRGVGGCFDRDLDHDGLSYQADWPDGTAAHPSSVILGSADDRGVGPLSTSTTSTNTYDEGYKTITFRTTESTSGAFYPFFSQAGTGSSCRFNFGNDIAGTTTNDFGKAAQYGTTITNPCMPGTPPVAKCKDVTVNTDPNLCSAAVASIDNGSFDADGDPVTLSQSPGGPYPLGTTPVTLTVTEPEGLSNSCTANVTVVDQQSPSISCPSPVAECTGPNGTVVSFSPTLSDNCPGVTDTCTPASGSVFPLGTTPFQCIATDSSGNTNSCNSVVQVIDTTPPMISSASASPNVLWPPNHKMVPVTVAVSASDICSPTVTCKITSVTSNEPVNAPGSGNTTPDWQITGDRSVNLRAERSGGGNGRIYRLTVQCTDASGNHATKTVIVSVPHDQGS